MHSFISVDQIIINFIINSLKTDKSDTILEKIVAPNCSYSGFSYHVVNSYLNAYDPICKGSFHVRSPQKNEI